MKNYNGKEVKLVCLSTGVEKSIGDTVLSFRGELATIKSMRPPHKSSASGYVNNFYAGVYNLTFVEV
jgi:hypothetical protein